MKKWKNLLDDFYVKYNDEYVVSEDGSTELIGYPKTWLNKTNYYGSLQSYKKPESPTK